MEKALLQKIEEYCRHLKTLTGIACAGVDLSEEKLYFQEQESIDLCETCERHLHALCHGRRAFLRGMREAYRWDGLYIFFCDLEMVMVCAYVSDHEGNLAGGIAAGPLCMGSMEDILVGISDAELRRIVAPRPCYPPEVVQSLSRIMLSVASGISGDVYGKAGRYLFSQESFLNQVYAEKMKTHAQTDYYNYPILQERELRLAIRHSDREHAQTVLNQILAYIYVANNTSLEEIKPRIRELLIVISRAALDAGADEQEIDILMRGSVRQVELFSSIEDLSAWLSTVMQRFIRTSFAEDRSRHAKTIYRIKWYIGKHYQEKLTLDELAGQVNLSRNYLCQIFKRETGESVFNYINRIRVEKSRLLLSDGSLEIVDIGNLCGFEDQSYFTKVFKSYVGMTPKKYRESRRPA
ncbi:MAG: AraC family transcriptional regulator [Lachnospiraceae bacterium]|nr:AraC family transcriptional regulator [Lachnospiraceae bacterium]